MRALVVDNGSLSTGVLRKRLTSLGADSDVTRPHEANQRALNGYDTILLTGTEVLATDMRYRPLFELVQTPPAPVLGICGGLHIVGLSYGVWLVRRMERVGRRVVEVSSPRRFPGTGRLELFERHVFQLGRVPAGYECMAWSAECPIELICSKDGWVAGVQAHIEFRRDGAKVLQRWLEHCAFRSSPIYTGSPIYSARC
jgi:GMP synthase-like glutamine amidotransferase